MKTKLLATICAVLSFASPLLGATFDYFLKLDGIDGESGDAAYPGSIEIESFSWGIENTGRTSAGNGGAGAGKVSFQDVHFVAKMTKASPKLMLACATGQHINKATIIVRKAGTQQEYLTIIMTDVFISSYQSGSPAETRTQSGTDEDSTPGETIVFHHSKLTMTYFSDDGTATTGSAEETPEEETPLR